MTAMTVNRFCHWALTRKNLRVSTVENYLGSLCTLHKLNDLDDSGFKNFICKTILRGAENLEIYRISTSKPRYVMTLETLKILGHKIALLEWNFLSKQIIWTTLHPARFLPGAGCSAVKMWLRAREVLDGTKAAAISIYDMASIGLAGYVTPKGWAIIHDPGNSNLQLKLFSINNCGQRASTKASEYRDEELHDVAEIGELKCALRMLREAMAFALPWNKSVAAIEGFLIQNQYCSSDLDGLEKQAQILSQFINYCLRENSNRWRGHEACLTVAELRGAWSSFFGARPPALLAKAKKPYKQEKFNFKGHENYRSNDYRGNDSWQKLNPMLFFDDICVMWNLGKCVKPPGTCATKKGRLLKHVCNFRPDPANLQTYCGALHPCFSFHK